MKRQWVDLSFHTFVCIILSETFVQLIQYQSDFMESFHLFISQWHK